MPEGVQEIRYYVFKASDTSSTTSPKTLDELKNSKGLFTTSISKGLSAGRYFIYWYGASNDSNNYEDSDIHGVTATVYKDIDPNTEEKYTLVDPIGYTNDDNNAFDTFPINCLDYTHQGYVSDKDIPGAKFYYWVKYAITTTNVQPDDCWSYCYLF